MPVETSRLLQEERRSTVLAVLEKDGRVTVGELVRRFGVSAVTVRADLDALAEVGALKRSHGGAVRQAAAPVDYPITVKQALHHAEKLRIAKAAAGLIRPEQTIILDSGTTTAAIAREIRERRLRLTVITNALNVALELCRAPHVSIVMLGGMMRPNSLCMTGPQAEHALRSLRADHLFLGVDAIHHEVGVCTPDILEAQLNALMMTVSREVTAVADFSKFQRRSLSVIADVASLDRLITDDRTDQTNIAALRSLGVEVMVV